MWPHGRLGTLVGLCGLVLLGALGLFSCTDSADNRPLEATSPELRSDHHAELLTLLELELPELMQRLAVRRAGTSSIEGILDGSEEGIEGVELRHRDHLRALYAERDYRPVWTDVDGDDAALHPGAASVVRVLRAGAERHGLWSDELHLHRLDPTLFAEGGDAKERPFAHVTLGAERRHRVLDWLEERRYELRGPGGLTDLLDQLVRDDAPLARLDDPIEEYAARIDDLRREASAFELALTDGAVQYAVRMRLNNRAWQGEYDFPEYLKRPADRESPSLAETDLEPEVASARAMRADGVLEGEALVAARRDYLVRRIFGELFEDPEAAAETLAAMAPPFEPYERLTESFARYSAIVAEGGWPELSSEAVGLSVGEEGAAVAQLQERLAVEDYYDGEADGHFDRALMQALRDYQSTHQLWEANEVTAQALRSLNISAERRWHQIRATLD
ncbi:MAG: peptidoglycan-binding protein, partial [Persicimonas sp.]